MSARLLEIYAVLGQQKAVRGAQDTSEATFSFIEGDTYRLRLNAQRPVSEPGSTQRYTPATFSEFTSFEAALGQVDAAPEGGKWKIKKTGGAFSTELNHNATPAEVKTAVEALAGIGTDKVTVTNGNAAHIYIIRPVNPADDFTFETQSSLVPLCTARVRKGSDGSGSYTVVKLHKAYFAFADQWEFPMPPEVEVISERTGSTTKNATQLISIPVGSMGSFELQHAGFSTRTIPVDGITAAAVESALNELFADGATAPRFRCFDAGSNAIQVECIGALAKQAVATLGIELYGQVPLPTPEADFALTELPMELFIATKDKLKLKLDIVGIDAEGREHTLVLKDAEILNSLIDRGSSATIGAVATRYVEVTTTVDPQAPIQVGLRSSSKITTGSGTESVPGEYTDNFTHNLNIADPYIYAHRLISVSPEKWEQVDDDEYTVETVSLNQSKVQFEEIPPATGNVGSIRLRAINLDAGVWTNDHEHSTDEVNGVGGDSAKTLTEIINELRAALPNGWPTVPGSALADASVTAEKLDLASLIKALFSSAEYLTKLRDLATDSTFVKTLLESMATSTSLGEFVKAIASTIATDRTVAEEWLQMFRSLAGFDVFLRELFTAGLQGVSSLPDGTVLFAAPSWEFVFPPPQESTAASLRADAFADVQVTTTEGPTTAGKTTVTSTRSSTEQFSAQAVVRYDLLSPAIFAPENGGNVSGVLSPTATAGQKYTATAEVTARTATTRRGRDWKSGTILTRQNGHWYGVRVATTVAGETLWPVEMEDESFRYDITADMFRVGTRFAASWLLQAALAGNATGKIDLICELGSSFDGGVGVGHNLTWSPIFTQRIPLTPALALHQFSLEVVNQNAMQQVGAITDISVEDQFIQFTQTNAEYANSSGKVKVGETEFSVTTFVTMSGNFFVTVAGDISALEVGMAVESLAPARTLTWSRYGKTTSTGWSPTEFCMRVRVANFDCEDTWLSGIEARGCMKLKIANPSASIAPL